MALTDRADPYLSFRFLVEVDGLVVGGFSEVGGLDLEVEVHKFREGGFNEFERQLPGPAKHPTRLSLKRGMVDLDDFYDWCENATYGWFERRDLTVKLLDNAGEERRSWVFLDACPVKWSGPRLTAGTAEVAVETVELIYRDRWAQ
jgi:phage tail-like protein